MFVCCECCVMSGRGLCDELITPPEESYRLWCVVVCDLETSRMRRPWPALGRSATGEKKEIKSHVHSFNSYILVKIVYAGIIYTIYATCPAHIIFTYLITYLLTPRCTVLDKLTRSQLVKKSHEFYGTRRFITAFTSSRHLSQS